MSISIAAATAEVALPLSPIVLPPLHCLPDELIEKIFFHLDKEALAKAYKVDRKMRGYVFDHDYLLQQVSSIKKFVEAVLLGIDRGFHEQREALVEFSRTVSFESFIHLPDCKKNLVNLKTELLDLIQTFPEKVEKAFGRIAIVQAKAGEKEQSIAFVTLLRNVENRDRYFENICHIFIKAKNFDGAIEVARLIADPRRRFVCYLFRKFMKAKEWDKAIEVAKLLVDNEERDRSFRSLVAALFENDHFDWAIQVTHRIVGNHHREACYLKRIKTFMKTGDLDRALALIKLIPNETIKREDIPAFIKALVTAGALGTAFRRVNALPQEHAELQWRLFRDIEVALIEIGDFSQAMRIACSRRFTSSMRWRLFKEIINTLIEMDACEKTFQFLQLIPYLYVKIMGIKAFNNHLKKKGPLKAIQLLHSLPYHSDKRYFYRSVLRDLVEAHGFDQALVLVQSSPSVVERREGFYELFFVLINARRIEDACLIAQSVVHEEVQVDALDVRVDILWGICRILIGENRIDQALQLARSILDKVENRFVLERYSPTLKDICCLLIKEKKMVQALALARSIPDRVVTLSLFWKIFTTFIYSISTDTLVKPLRLLIRSLSKLMGKKMEIH